MQTDRERTELDIPVMVRVTFGPSEIHGDVDTERAIWGAEIVRRLRGMSGAEVVIGNVTIQGFNADGSMRQPIACREEGGYGFFLGRLIGSIPRRRWSMMTEHVCGIEVGPSLTAIDYLLTKLGEKIESGWRLISPEDAEDLGLRASGPPLYAPKEAGDADAK